MGSVWAVSAGMKIRAHFFSTGVAILNCKVTDLVFGVNRPTGFISSSVCARLQVSGYIALYNGTQRLWRVERFGLRHRDSSEKTIMSETCWKQRDPVNKNCFACLNLPISFQLALTLHQQLLILQINYVRSFVTLPKTPANTFHSVLSSICSLVL